MLGGAAGALAGLVFVGLSLHAVFVLIPQQGLHALGIEPIIGGIAVGVLFAETPVRFWRQMALEMRVRTVVATAAGSTSSSQQGSSASR
jgi:hypothetical protein